MANESEGVNKEAFDAMRRAIGRDDSSLEQQVQAAKNFIAKFKIGQYDVVRVSQNASMGGSSTDHKAREAAIQALVDEGILEEEGLYGDHSMREQREMVIIGDDPLGAIVITPDYVTVKGDIVRVEAGKEPLLRRAVQLPAMYKGRPIVYLQDAEVTRARQYPPIKF